MEMRRKQLQNWLTDYHLIFGLDIFTKIMLLVSQYDFYQGISEFNSHFTSVYLVRANVGGILFPGSAVPAKRRGKNAKDTSDKDGLQSVSRMQNDHDILLELNPLVNWSTRLVEVGRPPQ